MEAIPALMGIHIYWGRQKLQYNINIRIEVYTGCEGEHRMGNIPWSMVRDITLEESVEESTEISWFSKKMQKCYRLQRTQSVFGRAV